MLDKKLTYIHLSAADLILCHFLLRSEPYLSGFMFVRDDERALNTRTFILFI